ncbi:hypothetical protein ACFQQB_45235 [Nonomuraea rubra]|uniref:hypothetical protein n=1 Tax=Nonomuraea rubra TaxID=46180 RepID=UPI003606A768
MIRIICTPSMPDGVTIATAMQSQLKKAGIEVKVVQVDDHSAARDGEDWEVSSLRPCCRSAEAPTRPCRSCSPPAARTTTPRSPTTSWTRTSPSWAGRRTRSGVRRSSGRSSGWSGTAATTRSRRNGS